VILFTDHQATSRDGPIAPPLSNLGYACTYGYNYLSYEDALNFQSKVCTKANSETYYRIQGGGSVYCSNGKITILKSDPQRLTKAICIKTIQSTSLNRFLRVSNTNLSCPFGYARATIEETRNIINQQSCFDFYSNVVEDNNAVLRLEAHGTLRSNNFYNCTFNQWDNTRVDFTLCIRRDLQDLVIKDIIESQCVNSETMYSLEEALKERASSNRLCPLIHADGAARLAGGAAMYGSAKNCMVLESDNTILAQYLCGPYPR